MLNSDMKLNINAILKVSVIKNRHTKHLQINILKLRIFVLKLLLGEN